MDNVNEREKSVERESKQKVAVVVLGRGVGKNPVTGEIEPTDYLEKAVVKDPSKGDFGPEQHPVINDKVNVNSEPAESRYAGARANVEAAQEIVKTILTDKSRELTGICWAAGRVPDMKDYAPEGWTQGMVLAKSFLDGAPEIGQSGAKMVFEPNNVNTWDDLAASLLWAQKEGCDEVVMVTVGIHMKRTYLMTQELLEGMKKEFGENKIPRVKFLASESVVMKKSEEEREEVRAVMESRGHNVTLAREQGGIRQMKAGTYQSQWSDGGKVHEFNKPVQIMSVEEVGKFK